jgi:hypothetical protein
MWLVQAQIAKYPLRNAFVNTKITLIDSRYWKGARYKTILTDKFSLAASLPVVPEIFRTTGKHI